MAEPIWRRALRALTGRRKTDERGTRLEAGRHLAGRTHATATAYDAAVYSLEAISADLGDLQGRLGGILRDLNTRAFNETIRDMSHEGAAEFELRNPEVLAQIGRAAQASADSIIKTYVQDLVKFGKAADANGATAADLPRLLEQWDRDRAAWKDPQIARTETATIRGIAKREFALRSGIRGHATFGGSLRCRLCQAVASGNPYDLDDQTVGLVPHPGCLDDWLIHETAHDAYWDGS